MAVLQLELSFHEDDDKLRLDATAVTIVNLNRLIVITKSSMVTTCVTYFSQVFL